MLHYYKVEFERGYYKYYSTTIASVYALVNKLVNGCGVAVSDIVGVKKISKMPVKDYYELFD